MRRSKPRTIVFGVTIDYQLRYHEGLYQRLADEGWDVHLVSARGSIGERLAKYPGISLHSLEMPRNPSPLSDIRALGHWWTLLGKLRPGITVIGTPKASLLGNLAGWMRRVPVRVYELHGLRLESASGVGRKLLTIIERVTSTAATEVVAVGRSLATAAVNAGAVKRSRLQVIGEGSPAGVDINRFEDARADTNARKAMRISLGLSLTDPVIVFVGRLTQDKGVVALADAVASLQRRMPAQVLVVGGVDDASGEDGAARLRSTGARVVFVGEVDDVSEYLAIADVFCLPTRREGLGLVILEAFAARVPVVATRATGVVDLVIDNETGRLVEQNDIEALADALQQMLSDQDQIGQVVERAAQRVRSDFDQGKVQVNWVEYLSARALSTATVR